MKSPRPFKNLLYLHKMNPDTLKKSIASRIALARKNAGLSQGQLAKLMSLHRPTISEIEAGRRSVTAEELNILSDLLGVELAWLACSENDEVDTSQDQIRLAARGLSELKSEDLEKVIDLLTALKKK